MTLLEEIGQVQLAADPNSLWLQCRECNLVITELWSPEADLYRLVQDAIDHVCGADEMEVTD